jgi:hypothetical protein
VWFTPTPRFGVSSGKPERGFTAGPLLGEESDFSKGLGFIFCYNRSVFLSPLCRYGTCLIRSYPHLST